MNSIYVKLADESELNNINELRKQLFDFHAREKTQIFKPGCAQELQDSIYDTWKDPQQDIIVAVQDETICGYAVLHHIMASETPVMLERDFLNVDEICVDEAFRGRGAAKAMIGFIRQYAEKKGFHSIELNVYEFNQRALAIYEAAGFHTYKRSMELMI